MQPLDLAIAGTRGVPACYSGFETFAEELGERLTARGHRVTVYGRPAYVGRERREYRGMQVVPLPTLPGKHLETPAHTLVSAFVALRARHDVVLICNAANAFAIPLFRLGGAQVAINVDGLDRERRKWGRLGKLWFRLGERLSLRFASQTVVDADYLQDYYRERYRAELPVIPYGGDRQGVPGPEAEVFSRYGLTPGSYALVVGRLEPENNALLVVEAYRRVKAEVPLVVLGDVPYASDYKAAVHAAAGPRVRLLGGVYGEDYLALQAHASCYVAAGEVGGTHPALVEAMCLGGVVVANDVVEHREVLGESALYYPERDAGALATALDAVLGDPELAGRLRQATQSRANERYSWEAVTTRYEELFARLAKSHSR